MRISVDWLASYRGQTCRNDAVLGENIDIFRREWGEEVELSRAILARAAELGLRLDWLAPRLFSGNELTRFHEQTTRPSLVARGIPEPDAVAERAARAAEQEAQQATYGDLHRAYEDLFRRCYEACMPFFEAHQARGAAATTEEERQASLAIMRAETADLIAERDRAHRALIAERNAKVQAARDAAHKAAYEDAARKGLPVLAEAIADVLGLPPAEANTQATDDPDGQEAAPASTPPRADAPPCHTNPPA